MFINRKKIGINLLFYLLSIVVLFIIIRVVFKDLIVFPKLREGLVEAKDIQDISRVRKYKSRNDDDTGEVTANNLIIPMKDIIFEHLDHADKYRNKKTSEDMIQISQLKKSAYKNIKDTIKKKYDSIKKDCSSENKLFERRNKEFKKIKSKFEKKKKKKISNITSWYESIKKKMNIVRNKKEKKQFEEIFSFKDDTGLPMNLEKDFCKMLIEDKDTNKGNLIAKQKMNAFIKSGFHQGEKIFDKVKKHSYFKKLEDDYKNNQKKTK